MKLKTRLVFMNLGIVMLTAACIMTAFLYSMYSNNKKQSIEIVQGKTKIIAAEMELILSNARLDAKNIAETIVTLKKSGATDRNKLNQMLKEKLEGTERYIYTWAVFEPNAFDGKDSALRSATYSTDSGQYAPCWGRSGSELLLNPCTGIDTSDYYQVPLNTGKSFVAEPATYELNGEMVTTVSFCEPIVMNGRVIGVAGLDISLAEFTAMNDEVQLYTNGYGQLLTKEGVIVAHKNRDLLESVAVELQEQPDLLESIRQGESRVVLSKDEGKKVERLYEPIHFEGMDNIWSYSTVVPYNEMMADTNKLVLNLCLVAVIGIIIMAVSLIVNSNYAVDSIVTLSSIIKRLATYDLSFDSKHKAITFLKRKDETGEMTNQIATMQKNFVNLIKQVRDVVEQVAASSEELSATTQQTAMGSEEVAKTIGELASGATEQARSTEEGSNKIYRLGELIDSNKELMDNVSGDTNQVVGLIDEGLTIVNELTKITQESNNASQEIHEMIKETDHSSGKIGEASNVIAAIAEQTNLLALNAAIEAARAGEAGKGFAVVAEEIRQLAEQSTSSTKQIDAVVEELSRNASAAVKRMEEIARVVEAQAKSVQATEGKFNEISDAMSSSRTGIHHMDQSVGEMNQNKEAILDVIQSLSALAEENAASTEEAAATTEEQSASIQDIANASDNLSMLAQDIQTSIDKFKI